MSTRDDQPAAHGVDLGPCGGSGKEWSTCRRHPCITRHHTQAWRYAIRLGATTIVMEHFDAAQYLELVGRYGVTHSQVVPTMFSRLLKLPEEVESAADISSLEVIVHAAAPCPIPVKEQMISWFGPIIIEYYAATEGNGFTFCDS